MERTTKLVISNPQSLSRYVSSIPMTLLLLMTLLAGIGENLHTRVLEYGAHLWPDYTYLRVINRISEPTCRFIDEADLEQAVNKEIVRRHSAAANDRFSDIFGSNFTREDVYNSISSKNQLCAERISIYQRVKAQDSWQVRVYVTGELLLSHLVTSVTGNRRIILSLMLLFCAAAATLKREHIALRAPASQRDELVSSLSQVITNVILTFSAVVYRHQEYGNAASGMQINHLFMHDVFVVGFLFLTITSLYHLFNPKQYEKKGTWLHSLLAIPLYSYMTINAFINFSQYGFYHGMLVYMNVMLDAAVVFLNVGLYVWVGLLLARSSLPQKVFNLIRVWRLPPKWLCLVMLVITSPPTAYTGASAVLIMAAGPAIYRELRRAGTSEPLTLGTIAIAGSMGTTLRPCLLVLIVAYLNSAVTSDEVYYAGVHALWISLVIFAFFVWVMGGKTDPNHKIAPLKEALPASFTAAKPLLPYVLIFGGLLLFWYVVMGKGMDEFSAPAILPLGMLLFVAYERLFLKEPDPDPNPETGAKSASTKQAIARASDESAPLIGAVIMLIALSMSSGGVIERSGLLEMLPDTVGAIWATLGALMVMLVILGMFMDPFGAILLVNASLFPWAMECGVDPVHFWIIAIMAFEVGYLTPPVALNHLITRQVVGPPKEWETLHGTFWQRHYHIIFPIVVMGVSLIAVAYLPYMLPEIFGSLLTGID